MGCLCAFPLSKYNSTKTKHQNFLKNNAHTIYLTWLNLSLHPRGSFMTSLLLPVLTFPTIPCEKKNHSSTWPIVLAKYSLHLKKICFQRLLLCLKKKRGKRVFATGFSHFSIPSSCFLWHLFDVHSVLLFSLNCYKEYLKID